MWQKTFRLYLLVTYFILTFGKRNYDLIHDHIAVEEINDSFLRSTKFTNTLFNRTTRTFSFDFLLLKELDRSLKVYQFRSNQYQMFAPLRVDICICDILRTNTFGIRDVIKKYSNLKPECPIAKGILYSFKQLSYDGSKLPPNIPLGKYKLTLHYHVGNTTICNVAWFGELREPRW